MIARLLARMNIGPDRAAAGVGLTLGMAIGWLVYALYFDADPPRGEEFLRRCTEVPYSAEDRRTYPRCFIFRRTQETPQASTKGITTIAAPARSYEAIPQ
jgi:hypothetical protein